MRTLDTNILVYAVDDNSEFQESCARLLERLSRDSVQTYLTWGVCYEFMRVTTHPQVLKPPLSFDEAWRFLETLLGLSNFDILTPTEDHAKVLARTISELPHLRGSIAHDMHTAVLMRENNVEEIYSHDNDFLNFPFLTVIDPIR